MSDDFFDDLLDLDGGDNTVHIDRTEFERAAFGMPGAKWRSLEHLLPILNERISKKSIWCDHFGGTGVVSWNVKECEVMVFNERYSGIVDFYQCLQNPEQQDALIKYLDAMPPHSRRQWIECRMHWVDEQDPVIRAAKWYYMTRLSVLNKRQAFGRGIETRFIPLPDSLALFNPLHHIMRRFTLENLDALQCARDYNRPQAVHYFDPPYLDTDQGTYKHKWAWKDMANLLRLIPSLKGFVALSHYPDTRIKEAIDWDEIYTWDVKVTTEPLAFHAENFKEGKENVTDYPDTTEALYIKEAY